MADPQGRLHALRGPGVPEGLSRRRARSCSTRTASSIFTKRTASAAAIASPGVRSTFRASPRSDKKAYKCTLCSDRVAVGLEPACIKACPTGALVFGTKEDMKQHAAERIEDLKSRGFEHAGLYDPPGVGGTHVMYVLHHADQPQLYSGLAADPHISPSVRLWKGVTKPLALLAMGLTALAGFFHYIRVGPNETDERDEAAARQLLKAARRADLRRTLALRRNAMSDAERRDTIVRYTAGVRTNHWMRRHRLRAGRALGARAVSSRAVLVERSVRRRTRGRGSCIPSSGCFMVAGVRVPRRDGVGRQPLAAARLDMAAAVAGRGEQSRGASARRSAATTPDRSCCSS